MNNCSTNTTAGEWHSLPLCCRYLLLQVVAVAVPVREEGFVRHQMHWGRGVLADGQCELVGAWVEPTSGAMLWQAFFASLKVRGVDQIRFVAGNEPMDFASALRAGYPDAAVLPSISQVWRESQIHVVPRHSAVIASGLRRIRRAQSVQHAHAVLDALEASAWQACPVAVKRCRSAIEQWRGVYALSMRAREVVRRAEDSAEVLQQRICRALARHGPFESAEAAAAFAELWFVDAESLARRRKLAVVRKSELAAASAAA